MLNALLAQGSYVTDELTMFQETARRFMQTEVAPNVLRWDEEGCVDRDLWTKAGELGLLCPSIPSEYGGGDGNFAFEKVLIEEQAKAGCSAWGLSLHNGIVAHYILHYGTEEQKKEWLPKLATGEHVGAIAMTEPGTGSDLQSVRTTAIADGDEYVLNGSKVFITNGQQAGLIIVVVKTDTAEKAKGISLVVVEPDKVTGFRRGRNLEKVGMHGQDTSELFFENVRIPKSNLLGKNEGQGFMQLMQQLPQERLIVALAGVAAIELALDMTTQYCKDRKAFGRSIIDFQNTRFKLAEARTEATLARVFVEKCTELLLIKKLDAATAAMSKYWITDKQFEIIDLCLQLHGGYGYMNEYPISRLWRDSRVQRIYGGTNEIMKELIGRFL
ncbi:acyl-CoA dehydrogenase family protein [Stenotrophobium rhamnosiphilum]|uniref:Acyl-[acyl-carrier-protein] dehydrogenase MbtN n=1 Tax=Stenotrophobium rhamnosiphilum TaxID=2029166 RepID=A0A2T5MIA9_9GAMM|nr:acyl-CoA dehydrogenase family protein [Stenotrophobium rhamnosiphilum]PTU32290.1 acyl-CoA dehydrogenase [Stenotrophobium rhamnosiphilum]